MEGKGGIQMCKFHVVRNLRTVLTMFSKVNKVKDNCTEKDLIMNNNNAMNSFTPNFTPNCSSPVMQESGNLQQYRKIQNPSSPMSGFYGIPYTPQGPISQPVCNSTMNQPTDSMKIDNLANKVDEMCKKLSSIDSLTEKIDKFQSTVSAMVLKVENVTKRVGEMEHSLEFLGAQYEAGRKEDADMKTDISDIKSYNEEIGVNFNRLTTDLNDLRERHLDLQTRSMRENLIFSGIQESSDNEESEETGEILKQFMIKELKLSNPIEFVRAHRFGRADKKPRPIVCRFKSFNDRELVRKNANVLKGKTYGISEQFPKEVNDRRKVLWPYFKEAKEQHKKAHFKRDRLFIDGKEFIPDDRTNHNMETDNNPANTRYEKQGAKPKHFPRRGPQKKKNGNGE